MFNYDESPTPISIEEALSIASDFVLQSPPGEVDDVVTDLRAIVDDDAALEKGLLPARAEYNTAQLATVDIPSQPHKLIICDAGHLHGESGDRYLDPRLGTSYALDHMTLTLSHPQSYDINSEAETFRKALEKATDSYVAAHYPHRPNESQSDTTFGEAASAVFSPSDSGSKVWTIKVVSNKYKSSNFWSGRWRSSYEVELDKKEVRGQIFVNVHYYEMGNVQLHAKHTPTITLPSSSVTAAQILTLIADEEGKYHGNLSQSFEKMRDGGFRGLRRVLPITREKIDWDKVMGYRLGQELANARSSSF